MILTMIIQAVLWIWSLGCIITYWIGKRRAAGTGVKAAEIILLCLYSAGLVSYYLIRPVGKWVLLGMLAIWLIVQFFCHVQKRIAFNLQHIILLILIVANIVVLCLFGFWDSTMPRYKYTLSSVHRVAGRQGVCTDGEYYWVSGSATLTKYDRDWNVVAENNEPLKDYEEKVNHIGDIDVYQNDLYMGVEMFVAGEVSNIQIAVYDGDTLERKQVFPILEDTGQIECSGVAVDPENRIVYLSSWAADESSSCLYMYDLDTGEFIGTQTMAPAQRFIQGVACYDGRLYITCDDGDVDKEEPDNLYRIDPGKDEEPFTVVFERSLTDVIEQGEIEGLSFDKDSGQLLVLYNRGARIEDGMMVGFYEGYTEEIHEVFVYDIK